MLVATPGGGEAIHSLEEVLPIMDLLIGAADLVLLLLFLSIPRYNLHG